MYNDDNYDNENTDGNLERLYNLPVKPKAHTYSDTVIRNQMTIVIMRIWSASKSLSAYTIMEINPAKHSAATTAQQSQTI